jgi:hypothetical protein
VSDSSNAQSNVGPHIVLDSVMPYTQQQNLCPAFLLAQGMCSGMWLFAHHQRFVANAETAKAGVFAAAIPILHIHPSWCRAPTACPHIIAGSFALCVND